MKPAHHPLERFLDPAFVRELVALDPDHSTGSLEVVLRTFVESSPELLKAIVDGVAEGDRARVEWSTHTLKGSARTIGATSLGDACERLERGSGDDAAAVAQVVSTYDQVASDISAWLRCVESAPTKDGETTDG